MNAIRRGILRAVDRTILVGLNAGKLFGFLGSGRDSVEIDEDSAEPSVRFRDLANEGWPAFSVPLPIGANFRYAAAGTLTRVALWQVFGRRDEVVADLESRSDLRFARKPGGAWEADLPANVNLRIADTGKGMVLLMIRQSREPESIGEVLRAQS
jgi:hypothetical protein